MSMRREFWIVTAVLVFAAFVASVVAAISQPTTPSEIPGCVYTSATPTLANRQVAPLRCDVNGKLIVQ